MIVIKNKILEIITALIILYLIAFIPKFWGENPLVIASGSMEDTLRVGGLEYYHHKGIDDFKENDIVVFKKGKHIVSHRIVEITEKGFVTKGDANNTNDSKIVKEKQVLGEAGNWCIPYYGYYVGYIYNHKYLLYIAIVLLFGDLVFESYRERKKKYEISKQNE